MTFELTVGEVVDEKRLMADLVALQYKRNDAAFARGTFRRRGDTIEIWPAHYEDRAWRLTLFGEEVEAIAEFDPLTGKKTAELPAVKIYANSHYVTPQADPETGHRRHPRRDGAPRRLVQRDRQAAGGAAPGAARALRPGDDGGHGLLRRHRELFALAHRPPARRPAPHLLRIPARARPAVRRREPRHRAPDRRHVPGRLPAQVHPGRVRLPPAVLHGQPPAQVRGVGGHAPPDGPRLRHPRQVGDGAHRRRVRGAGDPPHRPDRPAGGGAPGLAATASPRWTT